MGRLQQAREKRIEEYDDTIGYTNMVRRNTP